MSRKHFSPEFKTEVASKALDEGMSACVACGTFGVGDTVIHRWVKQLPEERAGNVPQGNQPITTEQRRIRELEAQLR
jgi:transposase